MCRSDPTTKLMREVREPYVTVPEMMGAVVGHFMSRRG